MSSDEYPDILSKLNELTKRIDQIEYLLSLQMEKPLKKEREKSFKIKKPKIKPKRLPNEEQEYLTEHLNKLRTSSPDFIMHESLIDSELELIGDVDQTKKQVFRSILSILRLNDTLGKSEKADTTNLTTVPITKKTLNRHYENLAMMRFDIIAEILSKKDSPQFREQSYNIKSEILFLLESMIRHYESISLEHSLLMDLQNHFIQYDVDYMFDLIKSSIANTKKIERIAQKEGLFAEYKQSLLSVTG